MSHSPWTQLLETRLPCPPIYALLLDDVDTAKGRSFATVAPDFSQLP